MSQVVSLATPRGVHRSPAGLRRVLSVLLCVEMLALVWIVAGVARTARLSPQRGDGLGALVALAAVVLVVRQLVVLRRGGVRLSVPGLAVHASLLMVSIAGTVRWPTMGIAGIVLSVAILGLWGRLAAVDRTAPGRGTDGDFEPPAVMPPATGPAEGTTASGVLLLVLTVAVMVAALSVRSQILFALVVLAVIFIPLERMFALHPRQLLRPGWRTDLVHYVVNGVALKIGLLVAVVVAGTVLRLLVPEHFRVAVAASPVWAQVVAGMAIASVGAYAGHRAAHEVPVLWRFHRVHHAIRQLDWLAANHLHPLDETVIRSCAVLPFVAFGFGGVSLGSYAVLTSFHAVFIHANVRMTLGPLRWIVASPQFHHWHHASDPRAYNTNYAGEFPLFDALFGTLYLPAGKWPAAYGVIEPEPTGYLRQLMWPFRRGCTNSG